jgi:hypothetical protein
MKSSTQHLGLSQIDVLTTLEALISVGSVLTDMSRVMPSLSSHVIPVVSP